MRPALFDESQFSLLERSCIPLAVYQWTDCRVKTLVLSEGFLRLFGIERSTAYPLMDNNMYRDTHPDDVARIADAAFRFASEEAPYNVIYRSKRGDGYHIIHAFGEHMFTDSGERYAMVWYNDEGVYAETGGDFSQELSPAFSGMLHQASIFQAHCYDRLTGLPNMSYFFQLAEAGRARFYACGQSPAMLFFDLAGMKYFNRQYGFSEGDKLIRTLAALLVRFFSSENCSRFGQDHFAAFTAEDHLEERLHALFEEFRHANGGKVLPLRVGIYLDRLGAVDVGTACDRAKYACDHHRHAYVSDLCYFDEAMLTQLENHRYIINSLDQAIREGWIKVYYQPIVRTANGRVCDEEALSRWIDPVRGMLNPAEFVPVLENAGLIYKLDLYVLEQVLEKLKLQQASGLYMVPQSLNISRSDFDACDIVEEIRRRVDEAGIPRGMLTIEVTESMIGRSFEFMKAQLLRFKELGFCIWMDDFGSGYSSLDVLHSIPFDLIKFDMHFMREFDRSEGSRIILTELLRMTIAMGLDSVMEGVETQQQVDFLREVGCAKLQGFYFCRPIPMEQILERYRSGREIGFENPAEENYYSTIGRLNLYDLRAVASGDVQDLKHYFDTLPMAILEVNADTAKIVRCNRSYRQFMVRSFGSIELDRAVPFARLLSGPGGSFARAAAQCREEGKRVFIEEELEEGSTIHALVRHIATNPVSGVSACAVAVLGLIDASDRGLSYSLVAQALSADYLYLYDVNLDTEHFVEYHSDPSQDNLSLERHGLDFFAVSRRDAQKMLYEKDRDAFISAFTKENVLQAIDTHGAFTISYRLTIDGSPTYVSMKAVRLRRDGNRIIIGVNNVDAQMKERESVERMREEQATYARISALSGGYIAVYTVDPVTEHYSEYSATQAFEGLGLATQGEDFFGAMLRLGTLAVHPDDLALFRQRFTREQVLQAIRDKGLYRLECRLCLHGRTIPVSIRAAQVEERDGPQIIVGINTIEAQYRKKTK